MTVAELKLERFFKKTTVKRQGIHQKLTAALPAICELVEEQGGAVLAGSLAYTVGNYLNATDLEIAAWLSRQAGDGSSSLHVVTLYDALWDHYGVFKRLCTGSNKERAEKTFFKAERTSKILYLNQPSLESYLTQYTKKKGRDIHCKFPPNTQAKK